MRIVITGMSTVEGTENIFCSLRNFPILRYRSGHYLFRTSLRRGQRSIAGRTMLGTCWTHGDKIRPAFHEQRVEISLFLRAPEGLSPPCQYGGLDSLPRQSKWHFWWTKWHYDSVFSGFSALSCQNSLTTRSCIILRWKMKPLWSAIPQF